MRKRVDKLPKCTSVIRLMNYDVVCTYDAAMKHDSFGIVT